MVTPVYNPYAGITLIRFSGSGRPTGRNWVGPGRTTPHWDYVAI